SEEKLAAYLLAGKAASLRTTDALTEALLASAYGLAQDYEAATRHADRAIGLDGGSPWAWGRGGLVSLCAGRTGEAIERLVTARRLAPGDPLKLNAFYSTGIGASHLQDGRFDEAVRWLAHAVAELPSARWFHVLLAASSALAGRREEAERSL